jgi:hypothetical protein
MQGSFCYTPLTQVDHWVEVLEDQLHTQLSENQRCARPGAAGDRGYALFDLCGAYLLKRGFSKKVTQLPIVRTLPTSFAPSLQPVDHAHHTPSTSR